MNTKLNAICASRGRRLDLFVAAGQVSGSIGARALVSRLPIGCLAIMAMTPIGSEKR